MNKITQSYSTPASWLPPLEVRDVSEDRIHQELIGDVVASPMTDDVGMPYHVDIVGDDEDGPGEDNVVSMGPQVDGEGHSPPPTFRKVSRRHTRYVNAPKVISAAQALALFRARLKRREPAALRALAKLRARAHHDPNARKALLLVIRGEVVMGAVPTVTGTVKGILKLALSPVAWATHSAGALTEGIGRQLESLSRKL